MDWEKLMLQVSEGLKGLCVGSLSSYKNTLEKDMKSFLEKSKHNIEDWSQQVLDGTLSKVKCEDYIKRQMDRLEFVTVKQAGIAKSELAKISSGLVKIIVDIIFRLLP